MPVGLLLRHAREEAGLSAAQISERTKIALYKIEALENGDFVHLPDGIYLDGIVQAYARELAIEPEALIERLHRERPPVAQDWDAVLKGIYASKQRKGRGREPWKPMTIDLPKGPIRQAISHGRHQSVPPARRPGRLAVPLISLLAAAGWGLYLHETTRPPGDQAFSTEQPPAVADPREHETESTAGTTPPLDHTGPADAPRFVPLNDSAAPAATPAPVEDSGTGVSVGDVSGSWMLLTRTERSGYSGLTGLRLGYELHLEQDGGRLTGSGWRMSENSRAIGSTAQTPISVEGSVQGNRLELTYTEGVRRLTQGKFVLLLDEDGTLRGRFSSNAPQSAGSVEAHRTP